MDNVWLIFLGSFLTFLATSFVEILKAHRVQEEKRKDFILLATQQLGAIEKGLDRLKTILEFKDYYDYTVLDLLDRSIKRLEEYQNNSIYLKSNEAKEDFIDLVSDLSVYLASVRGIQNLFYEENKKLNDSTKNGPSIFPDSVALKRYFEDQKNQRGIDLIELKRRIQDFSQSVKSRK